MQESYNLDSLSNLGQNEMTLPMLVKQIKSSVGIIPFVGAGMSVPFGFPQWSKFLQNSAPDNQKEAVSKLLLAGKYEEAAQVNSDSLGEDIFHYKITQTFGMFEANKQQTDMAVSLLPSLSEGPVLTTNFDRVLERVFECGGKPFKKVILGMRVDSIRDTFAHGEHCLIKLHGDAEDRTDRIFTLKEYQERYRDEMPLKAVLKRAMLNPLLFLGCSLQMDRTMQVLQAMQKESRQLRLINFAILEAPATSEELVMRQRVLSEDYGIQTIWFPAKRYDLIKPLLAYLVASRNQQRRHFADEDAQSKVTIRPTRQEREPKQTGYDAGSESQGVYLYLYAPDYWKKGVDRNKARRELEDICAYAMATPIVQRAGRVRLIEYRGAGLLLFFEKQNADNGLVTLRTLIVGLYHVHQARIAGVRMGMILHFGDDVKPLSIGSVTTWSGASLDECFQLMKLVEDDHCLLSERALLEAKTVFRPSGNDLPSIMQLVGLKGRIKQWSSDFASPPLLQIQELDLLNYHYERFKIGNVSMRANEMIICGNSECPPTWVKVEGRDPRKASNPQHRFVAALTQAEEVTIVALTHENTRDFLKAALEERKKRGNPFWRQLKIIFPSAPALKQFREGRTEAERQHEWEVAKQRLLTYLQQQTGAHYHENWDCLECAELPPFWGNHLVYQGNQPSRIRFSPLFPGLDQKTTFCFTLSGEMGIFTQLEGAFKGILDRCKSMVEWNIYCGIQNGRLVSEGIISHPDIDVFATKILNARREQIYLPIVLVMIFLETLEGKKICLQHRTEFNSTSAIGTHSNISGYISTKDVLDMEKQDAFDREVFNDSKVWCSSLLTRAHSATGVFTNLAGWNNANRELNENTWINAAAREVEEEIGISNCRDRFQLKGEQQMRFDDSRVGWFRIFSLTITKVEYDAISVTRPDAAIEVLSLADVHRFLAERKLNRLFHAYFEPVFARIYAQEGVH